jgi:DNA-binding NtrC family response regulator
MPALGTVLIVDSNEKSQGMVYASAVKRGEVPTTCSSCGDAKSLLAQHHFKVVFCGDNLSDAEYEEVIKAAKPTPVIVLSRFAEWSSYLPVMQAGAFDYMACPPYQGEVDRILSFALETDSKFKQQAQSSFKVMAPA